MPRHCHLRTPFTRQPSAAHASPCRRRPAAPTPPPTPARRPARPPLLPPSPAASSHVTVFALLAACGAAGTAAHRAGRVGAALSSPLACMLAGGALAAAGILPPAHAVYDGVVGTAVPLAACLALLEAGDVHT